MKIIRNIELEKLINQKLNSSDFQDYAPNGLQVEGCPEVKHILTGVTACQALLDIALKEQVDAVIVHHGFFWKNESLVISGMYRRRLKTLLSNDINLYAWHLPLDVHPELGNNVQLGKALGIQIMTPLESLLLQGKFITPVSGPALGKLLEQILLRDVLHCGDNAPAYIKKVAWCTGAGQGFIERAARAGMDAFISGEVSEKTIHTAREMGLHFYAAGHHATERGGVRALGSWLTEQYDFNVTFVDIPNPA